MKTLLRKSVTDCRRLEYYETITCYFWEAIVRSLQYEGRPEAGKDEQTSFTYRIIPQRDGFCVLEFTFFDLQNEHIPTTYVHEVLTMLWDINAQLFYPIQNGKVYLYTLTLNLDRDLFLEHYNSYKSIQGVRPIHGDVQPMPPSWIALGNRFRKYDLNRVLRYTEHAATGGVNMVPKEMQAKKEFLGELAKRVGEKDASFRMIKAAWTKEKPEWIEVTFASALYSTHWKEVFKTIEGCAVLEKNQAHYHPKHNSFYVQIQEPKNKTEYEALVKKLVTYH